MKKIILASASPRRAELLKQIGITPEILKTDNDVVEGAMPPHESDFGKWVEHAASSKLDQTKKSFNQRNAIIVCADTIVVIDDRILGKPKDTNDAMNMLRALSGREHSVLTGVALRDTDTDTGRTVSFHELTLVEFRTLTDDEIGRYVASGEPMDKAGAYGIQGLAGAFVSKVTGCSSNVIGLPMSRLSYVLKAEFDYDVTDNWKMKVWKKTK